MRVCIFIFGLMAISILHSCKNEEWRPLFNGKNLSGWTQLNGPATFEVIDGELVGTTVDSPMNSFLVTNDKFGDFILELEFRMDSTNSGVQFRSESKPEFENGRVHGYQVDFDPTPRSWTGGIYDEARRGWIYPLTYNPQSQLAYKHQEWNHCRIECIGSSLRVWINGIPTSHVIDQKTAEGFIALQVHGIYRKEDVGLQVRWKNIRIKTTNLVPSPPDSIFIADLVEAEKLNNSGKGFRITENTTTKKIDIFYNDIHLTSYLYSDTLMKPALYPIRTQAGTTVTRDYPFNRTPGERADHPHQIGFFFAHENVNGIDFWNASTSIPASERIHYGKIVHTRTVCAQGLANRATLIVNAQWRNGSDETLLAETTTFRFTTPTKTDIHIERTTELVAPTLPVVFTDSKDGLAGIRVARPLELPTDWKDHFILHDGSVTKQPITNQQGVTGEYQNSEGVIGEDVFGKRALWLRLTGKIDSRAVSLVLISHPENIGHPPYWLARGYGLMAANPFGANAFSNGAKQYNFTLDRNQRITLRYTLLLRDGGIWNPDEIDHAISKIVP